MSANDINLNNSCTSENFVGLYVSSSNKLMYGVLRTMVFVFSYRTIFKFLSKKFISKNFFVQIDNSQR